MAINIERFLPGILSNNLNSDKAGNLKAPTGSTANIDYSRSSGLWTAPTGGIAGLNLGGTSNVIDSNAATLALTAAQSGSLIMLDIASGTTVTLPAPVVGLTFSFVVKTAVTSNNHKVITDAGTTLILGGVVMTEAADTNAGLGALFNGTSHISILMNGTTTGGIIGTFFNMTCITATQWAIEGIVAGSGTLATCASTS